MYSSFFGIHHHFFLSFSSPLYRLSLEQYILFQLWQEIKMYSSKIHSSFPFLLPHFPPADVAVSMVAGRLRVKKVHYFHFHFSSSPSPMASESILDG